MTNPTSAANAYASLAKLVAPGVGMDKAGGLAAGLGSATGGGDKGFGSMLKDAMGAVMEAGKKSDGQTQAMVSGKANVVDVVTAVAETETAIDAIVAVRDRVIQSYEEIMKMPI
jgi:flagellar hook-basal body complex protein FliE